MAHLKIFTSLVQNKFNSLSNYPPLSYKTIVIGSLIKPQGLSYTNHIEHLFLINLKTPLLTLRPLIQRSFDNFYYPSDNFVKTGDYYQLIFTNSNSVTITHTKDEHNTNFISFSKCIIKRVLILHDWNDPFDCQTFPRPYHPQS